MKRLIVLELCFNVAVLVVDTVRASEPSRLVRPRAVSAAPYGGCVGFTKDGSQMTSLLAAPRPRRTPGCFVLDVMKGVA